jgi:hypothetical protein
MKYSGLELLILSFDEERIYDFRGNTNKYSLEFLLLAGSEPPYTAEIQGLQKVRGFAVPRREMSYLICDHHY